MAGARDFGSGTKGRSALTVLGLLVGLIATPLAAGRPDDSFLGRWRIAASQPAPWHDPKDPGSAPFPDRITGRTVTFTRTRIAAPAPLACGRPRYRVKTVPPQGLFQGGLTSPEAQAKALGFPGSGIRTLETGCSGWLDFHFVDAATALFALDNRIYTLRR